MSLWDNKDAEPWDKNVPPDLIPAIKHLRDSFDKAHSMFGLLVTMPLCYFQLHNNIEKSGFGDTKEYITALVQLKSRIGPAATNRFHALLTQGTLPAIFKGFFDFYLEGVKVQALLTFNELARVGLSNETRLGTPYLVWAELQAKNLIRSHRHCIEIWVRDVCDHHVYDPNEDQDEQIFWRKWQAPAFLIMKPSRQEPYDSKTVWDRRDSESSLSLLKGFADHYVLILESAVKDAAGNAALELAKQPKPAELNSTNSDALPNLAPTVPSANSRIKSRLKYRSEVKRAIQAELTKNPSATDIAICCVFDVDGSVELPKGWQPTSGDREFKKAYKDKRIKPKIEKMISKVRADMRDVQLLPPR
jgi:hypothetical protein